MSVPHRVPQPLDQPRPLLGSQILLDDFVQIIGGKRLLRFLAHEVRATRFGGLLATGRAGARVSRVGGHEGLACARSAGSRGDVFVGVEVLVRAREGRKKR